MPLWTIEQWDGRRFHTLGVVRARHVPAAKLRAFVKFGLTTSRQQERIRATFARKAGPR